MWLRMEAAHKFYSFFAMSFITICVVKVCVALRLISEEDSWLVLSVYSVQD